MLGGHSDSVTAYLFSLLLVWHAGQFIMLCLGLQSQTLPHSCCVTYGMRMIRESKAETVAGYELLPAAFGNDQ